MEGRGGRRGLAWPLPLLQATAGAFAFIPQRSEAGRENTEERNSRCLCSLSEFR